MTQQITVEVPDEEEAREEIYAILTETMDALCWVSPRLKTEDLWYEIDYLLTERVDELSCCAHSISLEEHSTMLVAFAVLQATLIDVLAEIDEAFCEVYSASSTAQA